MKTKLDVLTARLSIILSVMAIMIVALVLWNISLTQQLGEIYDRIEYLEIVADGVPTLATEEQLLALADASTSDDIIILDKVNDLKQAISSIEVTVKQSALRASDVRTFMDEFNDLSLEVRYISDELADRLIILPRIKEGGDHY